MSAALCNKKPPERAIDETGLANSLAQNPGPPPPRQNAQIFTQYDAAELMKISRRSFASANKMRENAVPELEQAVQDGRMSINQAKKISEMEDDLQRELAALDQKQRRKRLRDIRKAEKDNEPERPVTITLEFSEDEIKMIDKYRRKHTDGQTREDLIREASVGHCRNVLEWAAMSDPSNIMKDHYTDAEQRVDESGMSQMEHDEALKADMKNNPSAYDVKRSDIMKKKKTKKTVTGFKY